MKTLNMIKAASFTLLFAATFFFSQNTYAQAAGDNVTVVNSFEDAVLTGGQQGFFGIAGPTVVADDAVEFPGFIGFYDIDVNNCGLTMTLFDNSGAASLLLPDGRFDRYYFGFDATDMSNVSVSGGSPGLTVNATVTPLPPGYVVPVADLFGTGYPLPITLPNGGFLLELGGGTDLTELGQTISIDFGCPAESIPTTGEWGLIILALLLMIMSVAGIRDSMALETKTT